MDSEHIRSAQAQDRAAINAVAESCGLFAGDELEAVDEMVGEYFAGNLPGHKWFVYDEPDAGIVGAAYVAPETLTRGTWNLLFIGLAAGHQGGGRGGALVAHVEHWLREAGERILIVETSGRDEYVQTRAFYAKHGFDLEGRIREFYDVGDDKVVYRKALR